MKKILLYLLVSLISIGCTKAQDNSYPREENISRIMSYNVRNCRGMDDSVNYKRIADIINQVKPDIIAIQELDSCTERSHGAFVLEELAKKTAMHPTYSSSIDYKGGKYGIGILSKDIPVKTSSIALPGREEKRRLLIAEFKDYVLCCTHFSLTPEDQILSIPFILKAIDGVQKPLFLAGDMNSVHNSFTQNELQKYFIPLNDYKRNTIPSENPNRCIDFIYGYMNGNIYGVTQSQVVNEASIASDHLPVFVDVRLAVSESNIFRISPFLQNPTEGGMTISWFTNCPAYSWVEYGISKNNLNLRAQTIIDGQIVCNNKHHKVRLNNLKEGATYYYRVCSKEILIYEAYKKIFGLTAASVIHSFKVPASTNNKFSALVFNDLHKNKDLLTDLSGQVSGVNPDFIIFNGDCIDDPKSENQVLDFLTYINKQLNGSEIPLIFLRGNHEIRNAYSLQLREVIDYIGNKTYGAFNWGDTRFVFLDCGEDKPDSTWVYYGLNNFDKLRKDQVSFLTQELNSKNFKKASKKILLHHIPIYGLSKKEYAPCVDLWGNILSQAPFTISLNAHLHKFAYYPTKKLTNNYPVIIGGGNSLENGAVLLLKKDNDILKISAINGKGNIILDLVL